MKSLTYSYGIFYLSESYSLPGAHSSNSALSTEISCVKWIWQTLTWAEIL